MNKLKKTALVLGLLCAIPVGYVTAQGAKIVMIDYLESRLAKHDLALDSHRKMKSYFEEKIKQEERDKRETLCALAEYKLNLGYTISKETQEICGETKDDERGL